jgi:hypothetical protein
LPGDDGGNVDQHQCSPTGSFSRAERGGHDDRLEIRQPLWEESLQPESR